ncbi:MAG: hypothetical protein QMC79_01315 [Anaerosomatales bacterium]|nr:hypothetical protein [Anaerosomatales bacterium]
MAAEVPPIWNEDRQALHDLIEARSPELAGLYRQGVRALETPCEPGEERARLAVIGHCFRELMNNLPNALGDVPAFTTSSREDEDNAKKSVVGAYGEIYGIPEQPPADSADADSDLSELVTVQRRLLRAVESLAIYYRLGERHLRERDSAVVAGRVDVNAPGMKPWRDARRFFTRYSHFDRQNGSKPKAVDLPSDDQALAHLENVEAILLARMRPFFDSLGEIDDLLAIANAAEEEGAGDD